MRHAERIRGLPPIAGGAGWSVAQTNSLGTFATGANGASVAFATNVTAGQLIVAAILFTSPTNATPTFSDTTGNVTSWTAAKSYEPVAGSNFAVGFGLAHVTGPCTPKCVWSGGAKQSGVIAIGAFNQPGALTVDGTATSVSITSVTTWTTPVGPGTQSNDLLIWMGGAYTPVGTPTYGGGWVQLGSTADTGRNVAYLLNAPGNSAPNMTFSGAATGASFIWAISAATAAAAALPPPLLGHRQPARDQRTGRNPSRGRF